MSVVVSLLLGLGIVFFLVWNFEIYWGDHCDCECHCDCYDVEEGHIEEHVEEVVNEDGSVTTIVTRTEYVEE
jgi:hypothetical protein